MTPQFDLIGLVVDDMAASLAFYRRLGLSVPAEADGESHVEYSLPGGLRLAWDAADMVKSFDPSREPPAGGYRMTLAFKCADPAEVDRVYDSLVSAGHASHLAPWDAFWGQRYASVLDPDGNPVDLFAISIVDRGEKRQP